MYSNGTAITARSLSGLAPFTKPSTEISSEESSGVASENVTVTVSAPSMT